MKRFIPILMAAVIMPVSAAWAQALAPHTITVTGNATVKVAADYATLSIDLVSRGTTPATALQADKDTLARVTAAMRPFSSAGGISPGHTTLSMTPSRILAQIPGLASVPDQTPGQNNQVARKITVQIDNLAQLDSAIAAAASYANSGNVNVGFDIRNRAAIEDRAKLAAMTDARRQADLLAAAGGAKVDKLIAISVAQLPGDLGNYANVLQTIISQGQRPDDQVAVTQQVTVQYSLQ